MLIYDFLLSHQLQLLLLHLIVYISSSSQNLSNKLRRENFPESELHDISEALGCKYIQYFEDEDGKIYKIIRED